MNKTRCQWVRKGIHQRHHDAEWGVPLHDDRKLFEFLLLDGGGGGTGGDYRGQQYYTGGLRAERPLRGSVLTKFPGTQKAMLI